MKMTKRFEKKLKAFAERHNLDTNFNWDIGWFDILYGYIKIGSVRFVGYNLCQDKPKLRYDIYLATMYTRICYRGTHNEPNFWNSTNIRKSEHKEGDIWSPEDGGNIDYISEEHSRTATISTKDIENETEDSIIAFFENALKRLLNAKTLYKMEEKLHCTYECDPNVGWCDVYFRLEKVACVRWFVDTQEIYFIHCPTKWVFVNKITDEEKVWEFGEQLGDDWEWSLEKSEGETYRCSEVDRMTEEEIKQKIIGWAEHLKEFLVANKKDKIEKRKQLIEKDF